jgi:uncharacterized protein
MRILVIGDSHGDFEMIEKAVESSMPIDILIHTGDCAKDILSCERGKWNFRVVSVLGNCDLYHDDGRIGSIKSEEIVEAGGKRIFVTHGHKYGVKSDFNKIYYRALELGADIAVFGHSHLAMATMVDDVLLFNPGSCSTPRGRIERTYGIIEITDFDGAVKFFHKKV